MKHYLLIFLLLLSFNGNAIAGLMTMTELELNTKVSMSIKHAHDQHHEHVTSHTESSHHHKTITHTNNGCDGDTSCSACPAHCTSLMILTESSVSVLQGLASFTMSHFCLKASGNNFRLLRPPKIN